MGKRKDDGISPISPKKESPISPNKEEPGKAEKEIAKVVRPLEPTLVTETEFKAVKEKLVELENRIKYLESR